MGYCMEQDHAEFYLPKEKKEKAQEALKSVLQERLGKKSYLSWISLETALSQNTLESSLEECRWKALLDKEGNIEGLEFLGEKSGDDLEIFKAIAPFVLNGSYIEMRGEDGAVWRWVFINGMCEEVYGRLVFDY